jgi:hypothetical protein
MKACPALEFYKKATEVLTSRYEEVVSIEEIEPGIYEIYEKYPKLGTRVTYVNKEGEILETDFSFPKES